MPDEGEKQQRLKLILDMKDKGIWIDIKYGGFMMLLEEFDPGLAAVPNGH